MVSENSGEERQDWASLFTDGEPSTGDLFDFAKVVFRSHKTPPGVKIELPEIRRIKINVAEPDDTSTESIPGQTITTGEDEDAPLRWGKEGTIRIDYHNQLEGEEKGNELISFDFESSSKRHSGRETFDLVKHPSGEIKAIWHREQQTHSYYLAKS